MQKISISLFEFIDNIYKNNLISLNNEGDWQKINPILGCVIIIFNLTRWKLKLIRAFNVCFDELEKIPVRFDGHGQQVNFFQWLQAAQAVGSYFPHSSSPKVKDQLNQLERKVIALKYRLESRNGGLDPTSVDPEQQMRLYAKAREWKSCQSLFWNANLTDNEMSLLRQTCQYDAFVSLLLKDDNLRMAFFCWVIRDGIHFLPFIEFPVMQKKIIEYHLNGRIGRLGGKHVVVAKLVSQEGILEKVLALRFEGCLKSILNENNEVVLGGGYRLTIKEVFDIFRCKCYVAGNLELFNNGITNWNAHYLGTWDTKTSKYQLINLNSPCWWNQLPVFEILTLCEASQRYGKQLDGKLWVISAKASREYLTLNFDKTHAYLEIAIPNGEGCYVIYSFGKFATLFPTGTVETLLMVMVSMPATIAYPDENVFYTHRQHIGYSFLLTPEQGRSYMESINADIVEARKGNSVFQMESENCGQWIQTKLEEQLGHENIPNLFRTDLINSEPHGFLGVCWKVIRMMPKFCQAKVLTWCHFPLGAWKGLWIIDRDGNRIWKSLFMSSFWKDGIVYLPSYLHNQIEKGAFPKEPLNRVKEDKDTEQPSG